MCTWKLFDSSLTLTGRMPCTVSPVEKLTNRTTGTLPVRSRYGRGSVMVRSQCGRGTVEVRSRCCHGTVAVRSRYSLGTLPIRSWTARSRFVHACYSRLDAPRTWYMYMHYMIYCSQYGRHALPVRSWYGTLKVHSRLVFLTSLKPGTRTVHSTVCVAQSWLSWILFGRFRTR